MCLARRFRRWLRYRLTASAAAREHIGSGYWLTRDAGGQIRDRERRYAGIYRRQAQPPNQFQVGAVPTQMTVTDSRTPTGKGTPAAGTELGAETVPPVATVPEGLPET
jgi:hypothetical protein